MKFNILFILKIFVVTFVWYIMYSTVKFNISWWLCNHVITIKTIIIIIISIIILCLIITILYAVL